VTAPDIERDQKPLSDLTFDVTVEIPKGQKNKYEVDHDTGSHPPGPYVVHLDAVPS
jgi:inorganic pyrophosphatase